MAALPGVSRAADAPAGAVEEQWQLRGDAENWRLPGDESMGMVRLALRRRVGEWLAAGIDGSAAVRGSRGGFITLGVGAEALVPMSTRFAAEVGLSVQAGGGRGGYQLSGGGLMTRAALGLRYSGLGTDSFSVGVSRVDFPASGTIRSTQLYAAYTHPFEGWSLRPGADGDAIDPTALGVRTHRLGLFVEPLAVAGEAKTVDGAAQRNFGLVGVEWQAGLGDGFYTRLAAGGAASGSSSGYMQVLAGLGYRWPIGERLAATASASVGAGGGGGVDTGGGLLVEAAAGLSVGLTRHDSLELSAVRLKAPSAPFGARGITLRVAHRFGADDSSNAPSPAHTEVHPVRVRLVDQEYRAASAAWAARPNRSFGTLGVQADYFIGESLYVTGQGLAAYRGQNGAYMIGLAGAGWHRPLSRRVFIEVEGLLGAAGGGGTAVGSGVVGQLNAALGWQMGDRTALQLGVGRLAARRGGFAANVVGLSVSWQARLLGAGD
jgi:hypothetical protein